MYNNTHKCFLYINRFDERISYFIFRILSLSAIRSLNQVMNIMLNLEIYQQNTAKYCMFNDFSFK